MEKFTVTNELAFIIKTLRLQSGVSSKGLAEYIERSPSYLSKLEKGDIRRIQVNELTRIFDHIVPGTDFYNEKLPVIVKTVRSFYPELNLVSQIWLLTYDVIMRKVAVPAELREYIKGKLTELDLDMESLVLFTNSNRDSNVTANVPANELFDVEISGKMIPMMKIFVDRVRVEAVLEGISDSLEYFAVQGLVFSLIRMEHFGTRELMSEDAHWVIRECSRILNEYGIVSYTDYLELLTGSEFASEHASFQNVFSDTVNDNMAKVMDALSRAFEYDMITTAQAMDSMNLNMEWDIGFVLKLMGFRFHELGDLPYSAKKQLLDEIAGILEKYESMPKYNRMMEKY